MMTLFTLTLGLNNTQHYDISIMTLMITILDKMILIIMTPGITTLGLKHHGLKHNGLKLNGIQHNDTHDNNTLAIRYNAGQHSALILLSIMTKKFYSAGPWTLKGQLVIFKLINEAKMLLFLIQGFYSQHFFIRNL
jgi:hypothetical protein